MPSSLPQLSVRMSPLIYKKLRYIAGYNARSASSEVAQLIRRHIERFEKKHGPIVFDD